MLSRVQDPADRAHMGLDDSWDQLLTLGTENRAFGEFEWLVSRGNMREYLLVAAFPKQAKTFYDPIAFDDDLGDVIPF